MALGAACVAGCIEKTQDEAKYESRAIIPAVCTKILDTGYIRGYAWISCEDKAGGIIFYKSGNWNNLKGGNRTGQILIMNRQAPEKSK